MVRRVHDRLACRDLKGDFLATKWFISQYHRIYDDYEHCVMLIGRSCHSLRCHDDPLFPMLIYKTNAHNRYSLLVNFSGTALLDYFLMQNTCLKKTKLRWKLQIASELTMAEPISIESGTAVKENRISFFEHRNKIIGNLYLFPSFRVHF